MLQAGEDIPPKKESQLYPDPTPSSNIPSEKESLIMSSQFSHKAIASNEEYCRPAAEVLSSVVENAVFYYYSPLRKSMGFECIDMNPFWSGLFTSK